MTARCQRCGWTGDWSAVRVQENVINPAALIRFCPECGGADCCAVMCDEKGCEREGAVLVKVGNAGWSVKCWAHDRESAQTC